MARMKLKTNFWTESGRHRSVDLVHKLTRSLDVCMFLCDTEYKEIKIIRERGKDSLILYILGTFLIYFGKFGIPGLVLDVTCFIASFL